MGESVKKRVTFEEQDPGSPLPIPPPAMSLPPDFMTAIAEMTAKKLKEDFISGSPQSHFNLSSSSSTTSKNKPRDTELITGIVTQIQEGFGGMISGGVFFLLTVVEGPQPHVGDKVVVEATKAVCGMPFKFNGTRVQVISKDFINEGQDTRNIKKEPEEIPSTSSSRSWNELPDPAHQGTPKPEPVDDEEEEDVIILDLVDTDNEDDSSTSTIPVSLSRTTPSVKKEEDIDIPPPIAANILIKPDPEAYPLPSTSSVSGCSYEDLEARLCEIREERRKLQETLENEMGSMEEGEIANSSINVDKDPIGPMYMKNHKDERKKISPDSTTPEKEPGKHDDDDNDYHKNRDPPPPPTLKNNEGKESFPCSNGKWHSHSNYDYHKHSERFLQDPPQHHDDDRVKDTNSGERNNRKNNNVNESGHGRVRRERHHHSRSRSRRRSTPTKKGYEGSVRRVDIDLRSKLDGKGTGRRTLLKTHRSRGPHRKAVHDQSHYDRNPHRNIPSKSRQSSEGPTKLATTTTRPAPSLMDLRFPEFDKAPIRDLKVRPEEAKEQLDTHSHPHYQPPQEGGRWEGGSPASFSLHYYHYGNHQRL